MNNAHTRRRSVYANRSSSQFHGLGVGLGAAAGPPGAAAAPQRMGRDADRATDRATSIGVGGAGAQQTNNRVTPQDARAVYSMRTVGADDRSLILRRS